MVTNGSHAVRFNTQKYQISHFYFSYENSMFWDYVNQMSSKMDQLQIKKIKRIINHDINVYQSIACLTDM